MSTFRITGRIGQDTVDLFVVQVMEDKPSPSKPAEIPLAKLLGKYLFEGSYVKDTLHVVYTSFENAVAITIYEMHGEKQKTLLTQNFFKERELALGTIEDVLEGTVDAEDLIFKLKEIKDRETN